MTECGCCFFHKEEGSLELACRRPVCGGRGLVCVSIMHHANTRALRKRTVFYQVLCVDESNVYELVEYVFLNKILKVPGVCCELCAPLCTCCGFLSFRLHTPTVQIISVFEES